MGHARIGFLLLIATQFILFSTGSAMDQGTTSRLTMPQSVGPPDGDVSVPIHLNPAEGTDIGSLTVTIRFPMKSATFRRVVLGGVSEGVGAEVKSEMKEDNDEGILQVTIATPEKDGSRVPLPAGPLASLQFKVAKDVKPETVIPLKVAAATGIGVKDSSDVTIEASDSQIIVSNPAVFSCFFYMH